MRAWMSWTETSGRGGEVARGGVEGSPDGPAAVKDAGGGTKVGAPWAGSSGVIAGGADEDADEWAEADAVQGGGLRADECCSRRGRRGGESDRGGEEFGDEELSFGADEEEGPFGEVGGVAVRRTWRARFG